MPQIELNCDVELGKGKLRLQTCAKLFEPSYYYHRISPILLLYGDKREDGVTNLQTYTSHHLFLSTRNALHYYKNNHVIIAISTKV